MCIRDSVVVASGPLTSAVLAENIKKLVEADYFHFFDAAAPIVTAESLNCLLYTSLHSIRTTWKDEEKVRTGQQRLAAIMYAKAVSYTHLDVYKRQHYGLSQWRISANSPKPALHC